MERKRTLKVVFVGNPNTGKSTLINALAGANLKVSNWAGTTVEKLSAILTYEGITMELIDLPGTYDILPNNLEEKITFRELLLSDADVVVNVIDTGNLERNLHVTLELAEMGIPMVVVLNMVDEAEKRGYEIHPDVLEDVLGVPVLTTVAVKGIGVEDVPKAILKARVPKPVVTYPEDIERAARHLAPLIPHRAKRWISLTLLTGEWDDLPVPDNVKSLAREMREKFRGRDVFVEIESARFEKAKEIASRVLRKVEGKVPINLTERIDRFVLNPLIGGILFLLLTVLTFRFTFTLSAPWVGFIGVLQEVIGGWIVALNLHPLLTDFLVNGVVNGVGTVLSFAPVLFLLYLAISFLELVGLLARAAFLLDSFMSLIGLPGKAFVPLVLGFGCNVPAVYATRTLESFYDRLKVALVIPFMNCSARLTVHALFAAVFFPGWAPYVVLFMYALGVVMAILTSLILGRTIKSEGPAVFELPPYRFPPIRFLIKQAWDRTMGFVEGAGGIILAAVVLVWVLVNFPSPENSLYEWISHWLVGVFSLIGISDWRLVGSLFPGFIAKEVVIGSLAVSYLGGEPLQAVGFVEGIRTILSAFGTALMETLRGFLALFYLPGFDVAASGGKLGEVMKQALTPRSALAYMVFVLLYTPCVATVSAIKQEFGGKWATISVAYQLVTAFIVAWAIYVLSGLVL